YPDRPIRLIVPYPPGGLTDGSARMIAKGLSARLGQTIVVENVAGGGGNIGADKAAKSPADGYTLYVGNNATVGLNTLVYKSLPFDPMKDLAPIAQYAESHTVLVVHPSVPAHTVGELVALAKEKPGQLNFGSTGQGGLSHLVGEMFNTATGVKTVHIPYKGTGPALTDLLGGQIQFMFNDTSLPHIKGQKLRALAVTGLKRWDELPEVPTMAELGIKGYETYNWFGILAPAGTPADIIARLNREIVAVVAEPEAQEWLRSRGAVGRSGSVADFTAYIAGDLEKWTRLVKTVGITPE
ncbi:MAG TPA: tripartite tricarboxylate transporter substrate binding protein, partial [Beijerinckiaceae bacterium]|nr:tripartite tricarboxylate transporter substrate binding protein [Beijerinckiaceae bacterium]